MIRKLSRGRVALAAAAMVLASGVASTHIAPAVARGAAPTPLSTDQSAPDVSSPFGSGNFGSWHADEFGLPAYRYTMDQQQDAAAAQAELNGKTTAWHQVGNDAHHAFATNDGYTQLWSQARNYQWANLYQPSSNHFAGGYGYLNVNGKVVSTLYDDRPTGASTTRDFGVGYFHHGVDTGSVGVDEYVYTPFGSDPVLLHDVTLRNPSANQQTLTWFEYWDVNPALQPGLPGYGPRNRGMAAPAWDPQKRILTVAQNPDIGDADPRTVDTDPLSIFAAPMQGNVTGFETNTDTFFGTGGRATPDAVKAGHLGGGIAPPAPGGETQPGKTLFAFQSAPVTLAPGQSVTLRYAYGMAHPGAIPSLVTKWRSAAHPLSASAQSWSKWLPKVSLPVAPWLSREMQWDAYMVRSRQTPEEACGGDPSLSQGGYYQYDQGYDGAYRDPLQHMLPAVYDQPSLAAGVLRHAAREQSASGTIPYAMRDLCVPYYFGGEPDDLGIWLMWSAAEYGLATRDTGLFDQQIPYADAGTATLWDHLKTAYQFQELAIGRGIHGLPAGGTTGDWADLSVETNQMTESTLVGAQIAYIYPYLAQLADLRGDTTFAAQLRASATTMKASLQKEWTGGGWYSRGYSATQQIGSSEMWSLAQPWALLAGVPDAGQARQLVANFRRHLTGIGAPDGFARTGSALLPSPNDQAPDASGQVVGSAGKGIDDAVASWFALNGPMAWAYGAVDDQVGVRDPNGYDLTDHYGVDELLRNTLANLATVHPEHWDGIITVDDVCDVWWTPAPYTCGVLNSGGNFNTQILHQPAWGLLSLIKLTGIQPTAAGYDITPHLPMGTYNVRFPQVGLAAADGQLRGYVTTQRTSALTMRVRLPDGVDPKSVTAWSGRQRVASSVSGRTVTFVLHATAGHAADWAVTWEQKTPSAAAPVWQSPGPGPASPPGGPANCTASAGANCTFVGDGGPVEGAIAADDAATSFTVVDQTDGTTADSGTGPGFFPATYTVGHLYRLQVGPGSGQVSAGSVT